MTAMATKHGPKRPFRRNANFSWRNAEKSHAYWRQKLIC
jgi:hypothetical protein